MFDGSFVQPVTLLRESNFFIHWSRFKSERVMVDVMVEIDLAASGH